MNQKQTPKHAGREETVEVMEGVGNDRKQDPDHPNATPALRKGKNGVTTVSNVGAMTTMPSVADRVSHQDRDR